MILGGRGFGTVGEGQKNMAKSLVSAIITRKSRSCRKFNFFLINNVSVSHAVVSRDFSATAAPAAFAKLTPTEVGS